MPVVGEVAVQLDALREFVLFHAEVGLDELREEILVRGMNVVPGSSRRPCRRRSLPMRAALPTRWYVAFSVSGAVASAITTIGGYFLKSMLENT